jgi:hypothetical protein
MESKDYYTLQTENTEYLEGYMRTLQPYDWNLYLTISWPSKIGFIRAYETVKMFHRMIARENKCMCRYYGFLLNQYETTTDNYDKYVTSYSSKFDTESIPIRSRSHVHALLKTSKDIPEHKIQKIEYVDLRISEDLILRYIYKLNRHFKTFQCMLYVIPSQEDFERIFSYMLNRYKQPDVETAEVIASSPKNLRKSLRWDSFLSETTLEGER